MRSCKGGTCVYISYTSNQALRWTNKVLPALLGPLPRLSWSIFIHCSQMTSFYPFPAVSFVKGLPFSHAFYLSERYLNILIDTFLWESQSYDTNNTSCPLSWRITSLPCPKPFISGAFAFYQRTRRLRSLEDVMWTWCHQGLRACNLPCLGSLGGNGWRELRGTRIKGQERFVRYHLGTGMGHECANRIGYVDIIVHKLFQNDTADESKRWRCLHQASA